LDLFPELQNNQPQSQLRQNQNNRTQTRNNLNQRTTQPPASNNRLPDNEPAAIIPDTSVRSDPIEEDSVNYEETEDDYLPLWDQLD